MNRHLAHALALADAAYRDHLARGGAAWGTGALGQSLPGSSGHAPQAMPGSRMSLSSPVPVVAPSLAHGYLRHALRMRPHFWGGGDAADGDHGDSDAGASDSGYGSNLGSLGIGAGADVSGFSIGGFGGAVSSVSNAPVGSASNPGSSSSTSNAPAGSASNPGRGDNSDSGFSGYGGLGNTSTTMGRASDSVAGLGATNSGYGYSSGTSGGGYGGDIGPSGIATGGGFGAGSFGSSNTSAGGLAGFGNFGSSSLSDSDGLRGAENYGYGVGLGGDDGFGGVFQFSRWNDANFGSYGLNGVGNMGAADNGITGSTGTSDSPYGSLDANAFGTFGGLDANAFSNSDLTSVTDALTAAGVISPRQSIFGNVGAGSTSDTGLVGDTGLSNYSSPSNVPTIATSPSGLGVTSSLGSLGGFDNFGSADQQGLNPSMVSSAGYSPNARSWGAGFGSGYGSAFGAGDDAVAATGDPARALTVHALSPTGLGFGAFAGADEGLRGNIGSYTPGTLGTLTGPSAISNPTTGTLGFDNLGAYSPAIGSIAGLGTAPVGYSPAAELANVVQNPGDYFSNPSLVGKQVTPAGLAGLLGNFSVESNGYGYGDPITGTQASIVPGAVGPNGDLGVAQDVGVRKAALLGALGFAPGTTANAASPQMAGTLADQIGFNLGDAFSHPSMYGPTISALTAPGYSPADAALTIAKNFEAPDSLQGDIGPVGQQTLANRVAAANQLAGAFAAAQAASNQAYANNIGSIGVPGLDSGTIGGDVPSQVAAAPTTSYGADVRQALAIAARANDTPTATLSLGGMSGWDSTGGWNSADPHGWDSAQDAGWNAENAKMAASRPASDIAAADAADAAARQAAATPSAHDTAGYDPMTAQMAAGLTTKGMESLEAIARANGIADSKGFDVNSAADAMGLAAASGMTAFTAGGNALSSYASAADDAPHSVELGALSSDPNQPTTLHNAVSLPDAPTYHDPDAPDPTVTPAVTSTPSYFPGEKTALKTIANGLTGMIPGIGIANTLSALLGGPNVGSYLTDHSSPGEPANPSGGNNTHDNVTGNNTYNFVNGAPGTGSGSGSSSSGQSAAAIASSAYAQALKNLPGPNARKANPVPLVPPGASTASFYNPLTDPAVLAALRAAYA